MLGQQFGSRFVFPYFSRRLVSSSVRLSILSSTTRLLVARLHTISIENDPPLFSGLARRWDAELHLAELGARKSLVFLKNGCANDFDEDCPNLQCTNLEGKGRKPIEKKKKITFSLVRIARASQCELDQHGAFLARASPSHSSPRLLAIFVVRAFLSHWRRRLRDQPSLNPTSLDQKLLDTSLYSRGVNLTRHS